MKLRLAPVLSGPNLSILESLLLFYTSSASTIYLPANQLETSSVHAGHQGAGHDDDTHVGFAPKLKS